MGLTTSLYSGLTGLAANSQMLSVAGNNIANVNTTAYKRSRITFETQISRMLDSGSAPTADLGGTNPSQVGMGTRTASIRRDFSSGGLQPTGVSTDMAVEGNGFFALDINGTRSYTRDGGFILDRDFNLVHPGSGGRVQGYGVDDEFNLVDGVLTDINIPIGSLTLADRTGEVKFAGNLNAGGDVATGGTLIQSEPLYADNAAGTFADGTTALDSIYDADGNQLFTTGDVITVTGAMRGGANVPDTTFEVGAAATTGSDAVGTTLQDFMDFLDHTFGIDGGAGGGVSMTGGALNVEGDPGTAHALRLEDANIVVNQGVSPTVPITFTEARAADGESVRTTFVTYDSLGNEHTVDLTAVLEEKTNAGTSWRFYARSDSDSDLDTMLSTGQLTFDNEGQLISVTDDTIQMDHEGTGAFSPQSIDLTFEDEFGSVTALADMGSQISAIHQNGSAIGSLTDFTISEDGTITGIFSNNLLRTIGRVPLAMFANNEGLEEVGGNLFRPSVNSGTPNMVSATTGGAGKVVGQALELSNVELSDEFVNLIGASTGFTAASRVVTTSDRLIQELLNTVR